MFKKFLLLVIFLFFNFLLFFVFAAEEKNINTQLEIFRWQVTIWAPDSIDFPIVTTENFIQNIETSTNSWEYFWVKDLKSSDYWFYTQISITDFDNWNWQKIYQNNIKITTIGWVSTLSWHLNTWVNIPSLLSTWFQNFQTPLILTRRIIPTNWKTWMYWVKPILKVQIPAFQPAWNYLANLTYTLIEY